MLISRINDIKNNLGNITNNLLPNYEAFLTSQELRGRTVYAAYVTSKIIFPERAQLPVSDGSFFVALTSIYFLNKVAYAIKKRIAP